MTFYIIFPLAMRWRYGPAFSSVMVLPFPDKRFCVVFTTPLRDDRRRLLRDDRRRLQVRLARAVGGQGWGELGWGR